MKNHFSICFCVCILFINITFSQTQPQSISPNTAENISAQITKIAKSLDTLNSRMKFFSETFTSNQGLRLSDRQQQILFAFELLNRAEQSLSVLQKLKVDLNEKKVVTAAKLSRNEDDSRIESIDRSIALRGTTNAEELREIKRKSLTKERSELINLMNDIQTRLTGITYDIEQTDLFIKSIRNRVYSASEKELKEF
jgi:hypothetical protein